MRPLRSGVASWRPCDASGERIAANPAAELAIRVRRVMIMPFLNRVGVLTYCLQDAPHVPKRLRHSRNGIFCFDFVFKLHFAFVVGAHQLAQDSNDRHYAGAYWNSLG